MYFVPLTAKHFQWKKQINLDSQCSTNDSQPCNSFWQGEHKVQYEHSDRNVLNHSSVDHADKKYKKKI